MYCTVVFCVLKEQLLNWPVVNTMLGILPLCCVVQEDQPPVEQPSHTTPGMSEAMMKLATFWHDENADINSMDASHVRASCGRSFVSAIFIRFLLSLW